MSERVNEGSRQGRGIPAGLQHVAASSIFVHAAAAQAVLLAASMRPFAPSSAHMSVMVRAVESVMVSQLALHAADPSQVPASPSAVKQASSAQSACAHVSALSG